MNPIDHANQNMIDDPNYAPHCMHCGEPQRMERMNRWKAKCPKCTAVHEIEAYFAMDTKDDTPKVGVGIILKKHDASGNELILLGLRKGSHGAGHWGLPGGHQKVGESFWGVCSRELKEETGLRMTSIKHAGFTNDDMAKEGLHYVTLYFEATWQAGVSGNPEPELKEPDKCEEWRWFPVNELPNNIWYPIRSLVNQGGLDGVIEE